MFTNKEIIEIAKRQSAFDANAQPSDFSKNENVVVKARFCELSRKYLSEPMPCNLISYGSNIVASVQDEYREIVSEYIDKYGFPHSFETPNMHVLDEKLGAFGLKTCFMAEYFLPDVEKIVPLNCGYELKLLYPSDFASLYLPEWSNALCKKRRELDVLGVGAFDGDRLIGLSGCSADCEEMWQIGVDVLPEYRRQGVAKALTSRLACEILSRNKVPFYCCAWSNIPSARNAIGSGFIPSWVELTIKPSAYVDSMN